MPVVALSSLGKQGDEMVGEIVWQMAVADLAEFMGGNWSEHMMIECGRLAYQEAYFMTLAELKLFATRVKTGTYTSHKNFGPSVLMEHLQTYLQELYTERANYHGGQLKKTVFVEPEHPVPEEKVSALFQDFTAQLLRNMQPTKDDATLDEKEKRFKDWYEKASAAGINVTDTGIQVGNKK